MGTTSCIDLLGYLRTDTNCGGDRSGDAQAPSFASAEREVQEERPRVPVDDQDYSADDDCDPPEDYREYGDWKQDYANSVGMPLYEKIR